jgi:hypothetical protein
MTQLDEPQGVQDRDEWAGTHLAKGTFQVPLGTVWV